MIWFLSQCGNKAILRLDSRSIIDKIIKTLGLDSDIELIEREMIVDYKPGTVIIPGNWTCILLCSKKNSRRGRNLEYKYWQGLILMFLTLIS